MSGSWGSDQLIIMCLQKQGANPANKLNLQELDKISPHLTFKKRFKRFEVNFIHNNITS